MQAEPAIRDDWNSVEKASVESNLLHTHNHSETLSSHNAVKPLRILLLCDRYPYPLHNGQNLRIFHYVERLKQRHSFDLLCYGDHVPPKELSDLFARIESFPSPAVLRRRGWNRVRHLFDVTQMFPDSPAVRSHLQRVLPERRYDAIWVSGWNMIVNVPDIPKQPLLVDAVDDGVLEFWRELKRSQSVRHFVLMLKWLFMNYRFERRYFAPAAHCMFVSEVDANTFRRVAPGTPVSVIHNGVDEREFRPFPITMQEHTLVFEGKINFLPNLDGILAFCESIFPRILGAIPDARLIIVGMDPPPEVKKLASPNIEVTGFVDDVRPYVARAAVFVCPLRKGAGIKNKVLQAWSLGKAVVATPASIGGLKVKDGENIIVRSLDHGFAEAVIDLLRQPERVAAMGRAARQTIEAHYTWDQKAGELEALLQTVAAGHTIVSHA